MHPIKLTKTVEAPFGGGGGGVSLVGAGVGGDGDPWLAGAGDGFVSFEPESGGEAGLVWLEYRSMLLFAKTTTTNF